MDDVAELHRKEWKEFYTGYQNSKVELEVDKMAIQIVKGYAKDRLPQYWLSQVEKDKQAWNNEWGFGGRRYREMLQKQSERLYPVPDFLGEMYKACDAEGKKMLAEIGKQYEQERHDLMTQSFANKVAFQKDWNAKMGTTTKVTTESVLAPVQHKYHQMARHVVRDSQERQEVLLAKQEEKLDRKQKFLANARSMRVKREGQTIKLKN